MPFFLGTWLAVFTGNLGVVVYQSVTQRHPRSFLPITTLALEIIIFALWAMYWTVLYPAYFTPFRHLPTPPVRPPCIQPCR